MFLSFTLQLVAVTVGIVVSILTVDKLGAFSLPQPRPPIPRIQRPVQLIAAPPAASAVRSTGLHAPARPFVAPTRVPVGVPRIIDGPEMQFAQPFVPGDPNGPVSGLISVISGVSQPNVAPPPPAPAKRREVRDETQKIRLGGNVLEAKLVNRVMPVYPPLARQMRLSGTVRLEGVIARDGRVVNLQVVTGHPILAAAAVEAVRQWVYRPTLLNGEAVEVIAPIDVHFTLSR